jgi:hypothetical protein
MRHLVPIAIFFAGCTTTAAAVQQLAVIAAELEDFAVRAALLDPRCCYAMAGVDPATDALDVTIPVGHAWEVTNAFAVYYGDPIDVAQDRFPLTRRAGFVRPLDARRPLELGAGTRIRNAIGIHQAYLLFCDPAEVWALDARYSADPRALYFGRLARLRTIPTEMVVLEATAGGAINDDVHADLPAVPLIVTSASVYDASWVTIGCPGWPAPSNVLNEINNAHGVRFGESILQPMPACGPRVALEKGNAGAALPAGATLGQVIGAVSSDPAVAMPQHGSGSLTFQRLPSDW